MAVHHRWRKVLGLLHRREKRTRKGSLLLARFALRDSSRLETNQTTNSFFLPLCSFFLLDSRECLDFLVVTLVWEFGILQWRHWCHELGALPSASDRSSSGAAGKALARPGGTAPLHPQLGVCINSHNVATHID